MPPGTAPMKTVRCSGRCETTPPTRSIGRSQPDGIYKLVRAYSALLGFEIGAHALRATAATNALDHEADIAKVQEWLGHANIATTRIYDHRRTGRRIARRLRSPIERRSSFVLKN